MNGEGVDRILRKSVHHQIVQTERKAIIRALAGTAQLLLNASPAKRALTWSATRKDGIVKDSETDRTAQALVRIRAVDEVVFIQLHHFSNSDAAREAPRCFTLFRVEPLNNVFCFEQTQSDIHTINLQHNTL